MNIRIISTIFTMVYLIPFGLMIPGSVQATENSDYHVDIPFLDTDPPPLVLMVLGRDHKLYYEAYNDASDLDGDGTIDTRYRGEGEQYTDENNSGTYDLGEPYEDIDFNGVYSKGFDYYGYFDSYKCYKYDSTSVPARFYPTSKTHLNPITNAPTKKCGALDANTGEWVGEWSGDFLNYLTTTRMDALRKVLYGGYRAVDTVTETVLERVFIPQDSHTSGHEYHSLTADGYDIRDYTPYEAPKGATLRHLFASVTIDQNSNNYGYDDAPLLLTLANSPHRIWDWISSGTPTAINWGWIEYTPSSEEGYWQESITSHEEWDDVIATFANEEHGGASRFVDEVNQVSIADANPFLDDPDYEGYYIGDYYISVFTATLEVLPDEVWRGGGSGSTKYNAFTNRFRFLLFNDDNIEMIIEPLKDTGASITSTSYRGATIPTNNMPDDENATVVSLPDKWIMGSYDVASSGSGTFAYAELTPGKYNITFRYHELTGNESWYLLYDREIAFNDTATYDSNGDIDFSSSATISYYDFMTSDQDKYWRHLKYYSLPVVEGSAEEWSSSRTRITETTVLKPTTIESSGIAPTETDDTKTFYGFLQTFYGLKEYEPVESKVKTFEARVAVCYNEELKEDNCTQYANNYKPTGLLHSYGMSDKMYFGLLTGSYKKNTDGGVLRKNIGSFTNEVDKDTGQFLTPATGGIVETINKLRVYGYEYGPKNWDDPNAGAQPGDYSYADMGCSRISATMYSYGACVDWGNPVAEMMFEGMRYLAGQKTPHTFFKPADTLLNLPTPDWNDPYDPDDNGYQSCSKPYMLVISDTNPSYDSDELPGSPFALANTALPGFTAEFSANNNDLDVSTLSDTIYKNDAELQGKHFVGQTGASVSDNACSAKDIDSKLQIRGSCIENPGQQGSYYSAAIAYYGLKNDINKTAPGNQYVTTMAVALAAPLPEINIPMDNDKIITIVPFCKTLWGGTKYDDYLTTNYGNAKLNSTIVDFFVETLTSTYGKFRISYEDSEYGGDYDMDYIVTYEYQVDTVTNKVTITLTNEKISTFMVMHAGYFISGTTADGAYLEIRKNEDGIFTGSDAEEINFMLDTPEACTAPNTPVDCWKDFESDGTTPYPLPDDTHSRTFTPDTDGDAVTLLKNPLYFAAKWGGFNDTDTPLTDSDSDGELEYSADPIPNLKSEWDQDDDGDPDNYFYVTNPGNMKE
ncbi:MAG: hypothetical protein OEM02_01195, partial [Desulfobulbaceae bacterium]|nr:hypothetical protein [Desulfobulbaceae bacterium]